MTKEREEMWRELWNLAVRDLNAAVPIAAAHGCWRTEANEDDKRATELRIALGLEEEGELKR